MKKLLNVMGRVTAYALLTGIFAASVMATANARDFHRGRDWHHPPHWHGGPGPVVYAPAPVVYAPPPPESPGLNLILPINIR